MGGALVSTQPTWSVPIRRYSTIGSRRRRGRTIDTVSRTTQLLTGDSRPNYANGHPDALLRLAETESGSKRA